VLVTAIALLAGLVAVWLVATAMRRHQDGRRPPAATAPADRGRHRQLPGPAPRAHTWPTTGPRSQAAPVATTTTAPDRHATAPATTRATSAKSTPPAEPRLKEHDDFRGRRQLIEGVHDVRPAERWLFDVGDANILLHPPEKLKRHFTYRRRDGGFTVMWERAAPAIAVARIRFQGAGPQRRLVCEALEGAGRGQDRLRLLVIEVAEEGGRTVCQCPLRPVDRTIHDLRVGYPAGTLSNSPSHKVSYPLLVAAGKTWLPRGGQVTGVTAVGPRINNGEALLLGEGTTRVPIRFRAQMWDRPLTLEFQRSETAITTAVAPGFLAAITADLLKWDPQMLAKAPALRRQAETLAAGLKAASAALATAMRRLRTTRDPQIRAGQQREVKRLDRQKRSAQAKLDEVNAALVTCGRLATRKAHTEALMAKAKVALEAVGPIYILDAWGVPLKVYRIQWTSASADSIDRARLK